MTDNTAGQIPDNDIPEAAVEPSRGLSIVWLIPIAAALIGAWVAYSSFSKIGPTIVITFNNAEGLVAGKTKVKFKNVEVGLVKSVDIAEDLTHVLVTVQMNKGSKEYLTKKTRFWVVKARIGAGGVSGLGTLLTGAYIAMDPVSGKKFVKKFTGLEKVPVVTMDEPGQHFRLQADRRGSLDDGSPIYFRQIRVGEVESYELSEDGETVDFKIFVNAPHHIKVTENTRFWNASGIDLSLSATGLEVDVESAVSILAGGIAFEIPPNITPGDVAPENKMFTLHDNRAAAFAQEITLREKYLLYFDGSVRGLKAGAPVEFRGINLGKVVSVNLEFDRDTEEFLIPVLIDFEPERLGNNVAEDTSEERRNSLEELIVRGFRAQLKTGNLLTGKLYVSLEFYPDAEKKALREANGYPVFPTVPSSLAEITKKATAVLNKLNDFPLDKLGADMTRTIADLDNTIIQAEGTLKTIDQLFAEDSPVSQELQRSLRELSDTARSLRILTDYLERHPEALLRGKEKQ